MHDKKCNFSYQYPAGKIFTAVQIRKKLSTPKNSESFLQKWTDG